MKKDFDLEKIAEELRSFFDPVYMAILEDEAKYGGA
jgi:hypothetical protein